MNMQPRFTWRMETLAKRAKSRRLALELNQAKVAELSGLKQSDISKIENGLILKTTGLVALAKALRCDPEWLATGEGVGYNRPRVALFLSDARAASVTVTKSIRGD